MLLSARQVCNALPLWMREEVLGITPGKTRSLLNTRSDLSHKRGKQRQQHSRPQFAMQTIISLARARPLTLAMLDQFHSYWAQWCEAQRFNRPARAARLHNKAWGLLLQLS